MADTIVSTPPLAPTYGLHRLVEDAPDTPPQATKTAGINMAGYEWAHIQVVPQEGTETPDIQVQFWSEEAAAYIDPLDLLKFEHPSVAGTPYEVTVQCAGRWMYVLVTAGVAAAEAVRVFVAGARR